MDRIKILQKAAELTGGDRNETYGDPYFNMKYFGGLVSQLFAPEVNVVISPNQAALIMAMAKFSRIMTGKHHLDNYVDMAAYIAIAGECAEREGVDNE